MHLSRLVTPISQLTRRTVNPLYPIHRTTNLLDYLSPSIPSARKISITPFTMSSSSSRSQSLPPPKLPPSIRSLSPNPTPKIHLYTAGTPNGYKVSILLEELLLAYPSLASTKLSYDYTSLSIDKLEPKLPDFLKINPNGRIPALVDDNVRVGGDVGHKVFESVSCMLWLVENYDEEGRFWFEDSIERSKGFSWLFFIHGGESSSVYPQNQTIFSMSYLLSFRIRLLHLVLSSCHHLPYLSLGSSYRPFRRSYLLAPSCSFFISPWPNPCWDQNSLLITSLFASCFDAGILPSMTYADTALGIGPMQGQANHFRKKAPEKNPYAIDRYTEETKRLYSVLEDGVNMGKGEWLVGDKYSIVDMSGESPVPPFSHFTSIASRPQSAHV